MVKRSLRKGSAGVYLQYANGGDLIRAERFEVEVVDGAVVLKFTLRPVDSNQRDDERHLHTGQRLLSVQIVDHNDYIIEKLRKFCKSHAQLITSGTRLDIISRNSTFRFPVKHARKDRFLLA